MRDLGGWNEEGGHLLGHLKLHQILFNNKIVFCQSPMSGHECVM